MKKIMILSLLLLVIAGFTGCTSSFEIGIVESNHSGKMTASYISLTGTKEGKVTVDEGKTVDVAVNIVTKKGDIDVYIYKDKNDYEYEGKSLKTSKFTVILTDPGDYTIKVVANKHKGRYSFTW